MTYNYNKYEYKHIVTNQHKDISLQYGLLNELNILYYDMVDSSMDIVIIIDGAEGSGKSGFARTVGAYFSTLSNHTFSVKNIHFNTYDYINAVESGKNFQVNILDEAREAINKRRALSASNVTFTDWLSENRDRRQIHIILCPAVHDIDYYVSIWRMSLLIHTMKLHKKDKKSQSGYRLLRGYYRIYANDKEFKERLFNPMKYGRYTYGRYRYQGFMRYNEVFEELEYNAYEQKKREQRMEKYKEKEKTNKTTEARNKVIKLLYDRHAYDIDELAMHTQLSKQMIKKIIK